MPPPPETDRDENDNEHSAYNSSESDGQDDGESKYDEEDEEEEDDEEPRLKYTRLTKSLGGVYRNGDAVSASVVFGDRMVRDPFHYLLLVERT